MDYTLITIISLILLLIGIAGTILPGLPGLVLSFCGLLLYKFGANPEMSSIYLWIFGLLTLVSALLSYIIPARTNRKYGGTRWGSVGSVIGTVIGFFLPVPLGFLIGMFAGVFIGELLHDVNDRKKAFNSVKGALVGFIYGVGFNLTVGLAMLILVIADIFKTMNL